MKSTDGGATWSWLNTTDGNPIYGLSCPTASVCYATDIYAHVVKTTDGGATWTWQQTPITTPGTNVPGSGGPNPFAGLMAISCSDASTCVASGLYVVPSAVRRSRAPTRRSSRRPTAARRGCARRVTPAPATTCTAISCLPGTHDLHGSRPRRQDRHDDRPRRPGRRRRRARRTCSNSVTCLSTSFCMAVGQSGTVDVVQRHDVDGDHRQRRHRNARERHAASSTSNCYATGKQGITIATTNGGGRWTQQAGGGTTAADERRSPARARARATRSVRRNAAATILKTSNGGQTWLAADERHDQRAQRRRLRLGEHLRRSRRGRHSSRSPPTARRGRPARRARRRR